MWFDNDLFDGIEDEEEDRVIIGRKMKQIGLQKQADAHLKRERKAAKGEEEYEGMDADDDRLNGSDDDEDSFRPRKKVKLPPGLLGDNALAVAQDDDISIDDEV
jgi:hypothetical protein